MKRILALFLAIALLVSTFSIYASATETADFEDDPRLELACEVFPEYADKIRCNCDDTSMLSRINTADNARELVVSETRATSDNEYITYTEYSDGVIFLTDYVYGKNVTITEEYPKAFGVMRTMDIYAYCIAATELGNITFKDIEYTIFDNDFDVIRSIGTTSSVYRCEVLETDYLLSESPSENAYITFDIKWYTRGTGQAGYFITSALRFSLGNNTPYVTHYAIP